MICLKGFVYLSSWNSGNQVSDGIDKRLLKKMEWKEGQGLEKNKEDPTVPIIFEIKLNRKGLEADGLVKETVQKQLGFCEVLYKRTEQSLKIFNNFFSKSLKLVL